MKIGDRVKFLNDTGGGIITRFLEPDKVLVKIEEGFEVPTMLNQLIPDSDEKQDLYHEKKNAPKSNSLGEMALIRNPGDNSMIEMKPVKKNSGKVYLAFTHEGNPFNTITSFINDTNYNIYYVVGIRKMEQQLFKYSGSLEPNTKVILGPYKILHPDEPTIFSVQYIGYKKGYYNPIEPVNYYLEINTRKLVDCEYEDKNDFFDEPASVFEINPDNSIAYIDHLKNDNMRRIIIQKEDKDDNKNNDKYRTKSDIVEVDLHIHEIVEDHAGLTDGEILDLQLKRFETVLDSAMHKKIKKIVFIHGVGQGRLKYEIARILDKKYPDLKYQDASFREYGYGATMVLL